MKPASQPPSHINNPNSQINNMKRVRTVRVPASIASSDSEGNVDDPQPAKKPRKSSVKSKVSTSGTSPDVKVKIKRAKAEKKEVV